MKFFKPKFWDKNEISFFSILLFPISLLIKLLGFFIRSLTKTHKCSIPVICVGNIYLGRVAGIDIMDWHAAHFKRWCV